MYAALQPSTKRRPRFPVYLEATIETGMVVGRGRVLNLSEGGLFVATNLKLDIGTRATLVQRDPGIHRLRATGIVVHRAPYIDHAGLGIRFMSPVAATSVRAIFRELELQPLAS